MLGLENTSDKNQCHQVNLSDHGSGRVSERYGNYSSRVRSTARNYSRFRSWNGQLSAERKMVEEGDDSRFCSPPLWRTSPTASPPRRKNHYRSLSPESKAQAIARGQRELMEMVSRMPESSYELTLKDLVEQQPMAEGKQESFREEKEVRNEDMHGRVKEMKRNEKRMEIMKRNGSRSKNNEGFLLKMVLPVAFGTRMKKNKKNDSVPNNFSSKVSPKSPTPEGSEKAVDKEWWKKGFSVQSETESSGSSSNNGSGKSSVNSNSSSSISRSTSRFVAEIPGNFTGLPQHFSSGNERTGCWSFICIKRRKAAE